MFKYEDNNLTPAIFLTATIAARIFFFVFLDTLSLRVSD